MSVNTFFAEMPSMREKENYMALKFSTNLVLD